MKRGWWIFFGVLGVVLFFIGAFLYMSLAKPKSSGEQTVLQNPANGLTFEEAKLKFDESFVYFLLVAIKAYELHNPPLSSDSPKIEIVVGDKPFSAIIDKGQILVATRNIDNPDIRINTPLDEAVLMVQNPNYVPNSFADGKSGIELLASKTTLFSKGYLGLYTELTGKSVTGNVARIYTG